MKELRIYDHLGELKKKFDVYVEGEDFRWQSSYPEVVWLGTITLEELGGVPIAEPTPEPKIETTDLGVIPIETPIVAQVAKIFEKPEPEVIEESGTGRTAEEEFGKLPEPEDTRQREKDMRQAAVEAGYLEPEVNEEEVKDAPERSNRKRSRVKRATPPASPESTEGLHQEDSPGDTPKGD